VSDAEQALAFAGAALTVLGALTRVSMRPNVHRCGVPALLLGWVALLTAAAPDLQRAHAWLLVAAAGAALAIGWWLAGRLQGHETWLLAAGAAVLTLRVPVPSGEGTAMLLGPLYAMIAVGSLVLIRTDRAAGPAGGGWTRSNPERGGATRLIDAGTAVFPVVAALSLLWSFQRSSSVEALAFFVVPFLLAYALVRRWVDAGARLQPAAWALTVSGAVAATVGLVQAVTRHVWWNEKVIDSNRFRPDFRTNSLYFDPNIYGRALVVAVLAVAAWMLLARVSARGTLAASALLALFTVALWNTYSQSSWVALAAGLVLIAVLTLPPVLRRWAAAALAAIVLAGVPVAADRLAGSDTDGRSDVVRTGLALAGEEPVRGWGIGSFEVAAEARAIERGDADPGLLASHTTPVTVLAELGVLGAGAYLMLLTSAFVAMLARWRSASTPAAAARARGDDAGAGWPSPMLVWASAVLAALFAHSLLYAGFFEDATLWVALALLATLPPVQHDVVHQEPALSSRN